MLGRTHALSGAVVWLAGCGVVQTAGAHPGIGPVVVGSAVAAGAALLPDLDHPCSTVARTGGLVTEMLCRALARGCAWVHERTRTPLDRHLSGGHRTATHTGLFAVVLGALTGLVAWAGAIPAAVTVAVLVALGVLATARRRWTRRLALPLGALVAAGAWWLHAGPVLVGLATAVGCLTHCLGDAATNSGCPILWPVKIRGQRWYRLGTPRAVRFGTGGVAELVVRYALLGLGMVEIAWLGQLI